MKKVSQVIPLIALLFLATHSPLFAQNISGTVNDYAEVTGASGSVITVPTAADIATFSVGDKILLFQMKGTVIDETNTASYGDIIGFDGAGNYEQNEVATKSGNTLTLSVPICKNYKFDIHPVQVIRMPVYADPTIVGEITGKPWDGKTGGVIALEATGTVTMQADINAESLGFRGGDVSTGASATTSANYVCDISSGEGGIKGEGIIEIPNAACRGKLANGGGGGNDHNSGGGGGANYGAGGLGGKGWPDEVDEGGVGGQSLSMYYTEGLPRLFLGGGGGGGHQNNGATAPASDGGGIVLIRANELNVAVSASISAKALDAPDIIINDGAGGGGAGGSVLLQIDNYVTPNNLTVNASGGDGASLTTGAGHGPGGGGGGGFIHSNVTLPAGINVDVSGGQPGVFIPSGGGATDTRDAAVGQPGATLQGNLSLQVCSNPPALDLDDTQAGSGYLSSFTGSSLAIANAGQVVITDADGTTIDLAVVTLTNPLDGSDEQLFVDNAATIQSTYGITVTVSANGHSLTLNGTAPLANYETVLGLVKYDNAAGTPTTDDRVVEVILNDGGADSNTTNNRIGINAIPAKDTDGDGVLDEDDLDDDNDGIPDNVEDPCQKSFAFNFSAEGWYTINNNNNNQVGSNPASHSTDPATGNDGCTISITGPANENIAGASPTNTNYIVDADPNGGLMYLRSPDFDGLDYRGLLGGTFQYDAYNYRVGYSSRANKNPNWINNAKATVFIYDIQGNVIQAESTVTNGQFTNWENGSWNTFAFPIDDATWSGNAARLNDVLTDVDYISIRMEYIGGGNTGNCADVEYYAMDNVVLTSLPSCENDDDNDGIPNSLDLDSDNDGIYDAVEAGHGQPHTNGTVNGPVGEDGIPDRVQGNGNEGSGNTYYPPILDLDGDDDSGAGAANYQTAFTEGDTDLIIADTDATLTDGDDTDLESLTVVLTNRPDGTDEGLSIDGTLPSNITISDPYDNADGTLVLSGTAPIADYLTAIRQIVYNNGSDTPDATERTITVVASDGEVNSNTATTTLTVTPVNDAPAVDLDADNSSTATDADYQTSFAEGDTDRAVVDSDVILTDPDNTQLTSVSIKLTNRPDGTDEGLSILGALPTGISITDSYDNTDGQLVLSGPASLADYQTALQQVVYNNSSENPDAANRSITVVANDGTVDSNVGTTTLMVAPVNDTPVLDLDANDNSGATDANYLTSFNEGNTNVSIADTDVSLTDTDDTQLNQLTITLNNRPDGAAEGLSIDGTLPSGITVSDSYDNADGQLVLSGNATLAAYQTALQQVVYNNTSDTPNETARTITVVANDGEDNSNTAITTINVAAVNDAPVVDLDADDDGGATDADYRTSFTEGNTNLVIVDSDVSLMDVDNTELSSLTITLNNRPDGTDEGLSVTGTLPTGISVSDSYDNADGTLVLSGNASLAAYQTALQQVVYDNVSQNPDETARTISVIANDGDQDSNSGTTTITVARVNDAAVLDLDGDNNTAADADYAGTFTEGGGAVVIADTDASLIDEDDTDLESLTVVITNLLDGPAEDLSVDGTLPTGISANYDNDTLKLTGTAPVADYLTALRQVRYNNTSENPSTTDRIVTVVTNDGDTDGTAATATIAVNAQNDAAALDLDGDNSTAADAKYAGTFTEGGGAVAIADADASLSDADDTNLESLTVIITNLADSTAESLSVDGTLPPGISASYNSGTGTLELTGTASVSAYLTALQQLRYENASEDPDTTTRIITVVASDGDTDSNVATATITVNAINDPPVTNNGAIEIDADEEDKDVPLSLMAPSDVDDATLTITVTALPDLGILTLSDGTAVTLNQVLTPTQLTSLQYDAPVDYDGVAAEKNFEYEVSDDEDETVAQVVSFNLSTVNDAPVIAAQSTTEATDEEVALVFNTTNNNALSVNDADEDAQTVTITATDGTFTLASVAGLTFITGDGNGDATMKFSGSLTDINTALAGASFLPDTDYAGTATVQLVTDDGQPGGTATETITINVSNVNDAPVVTVPAPASQETPEDTDLTFNTTNGNVISVDDADGDDQTVTVTATEGVINLSQTTNLTFAPGSSNNAATMTFSGSLVDINAALLGVAFTPDTNYNGLANVTVATEDADAQDSKNFDIDVKPDNDAPTVDVPVTQTTDEDTDLVFSAATTNPIKVNDIDGDLQTVTLNVANGTFSLSQITDLTFTIGDGTSDTTMVFSGTLADINAALEGAIFTPGVNYNGTEARVVLSANDGALNSGDQTVNITVDGQNDAPIVAQVDKNPVNEDQPVTFAQTDFEGQFSDVDGQVLAKIQIISLPENGTLLLDGNTVEKDDEISAALLSQLTVVPDENFNGTDSFRWNGSDGTTYAQNAADVRLEYTPVNDAPVSNVGGAKTVTAQEEQENIPLDMPAPSDVDNDDATLIIKVDELPALGTITLADGTPVTLGQTLTPAQLAGLQYDAPADYDGTGSPVTFAYTVSDGDETVRQTVDFNLSTINDAPVANNGGDVTIDANEEEENIALNLAAPTDVDNDDDDLVITVTELPAVGLGTVTLADGTPLTVGQVLPLAELADLQYDAPADYDGTSGPGIFIYTVSDGEETVTQTVNVNLSAVNDAPTVAADPSVNTDEDQGYPFTVADFSTGYQDEEGNAFNGIKITGLTTAGTLTLNGADVALNGNDAVSLTDLNNGTLVFTPTENEAGDNYATFTFQVADDQGNYSGDYTMTIDVDPVGDAPVSADRTITIDEDNPYLFAETDFAFTDDADNDPFAAVIITNLPDDGVLEYDGNPVTESNVNDAMAFADRSLFVFTPTQDEFGNPYTTFGFRVADDGGDTSQVHTVRMDVTSVNDAPEVAEVTNNGIEDTPLPFTAADFTASFSDVDSDTLTKIQIKTLPANGTLQLNGTDVVVDAEIDVANLDQLVFVPDENFNGITGFGWNGSDGEAYADDNALVTITLDAADDAPEVNEITKSGTEDVPVLFVTNDFTDQFIDADGDLLATVKITSLPTDGTLLLDGDTVRVNDEIAVADLGQLTLVPTPDFNGPTVFSWNGSDGTNYALDSALVTVTLATTPDAPVVSELTKAGTEDVTIIFTAADFTDRFTDVDGDDLSKIKIVSLPLALEGTLQLNGVAVVAGDEIDAALLDQLTFVPFPDFNGEVAFAWNGYDGTAYAADDATVAITVEAVNDIPTVTDVSKPDGVEDQSVTFIVSDFTDQFSDVDGDTLVSVQITELPTNGTLLLNGVVVNVNDEISVVDLANLTLVPDADYVGTVSFRWNGSDGENYATLPGATVSVDFAATPDAPTVADVAKVPVNEEESVSFVATDFTDQFSDADGDALASVRITRLPTHGILFLDGVAVNQDDEIDVAQLSQLTVVPNEHFFGTDSLGWNATDGTEYAVGAAKVLLTFLPVQDAPDVNNIAKNAAAGFAAPFTAAEFSIAFTDVDDEPLANIRVISLPTNGMLYLDGVAVNPNDEIAAADLEKLTYVPTDGYTGPDSFAWNGFDGTDYAADDAQVLINVLPQEPPVLSDVPKTSDEDETVAFAPGDFISQFDDPENDPLTKIKITSLPIRGVLLLDGVPVERDDEIDAIDLSKLTLVPPANFNGTVSFSWNAHDGFQYADDEAAVTITINAVPDRPVLSEVEKSGEEDQTLPFNATDFTNAFSDGDDDLLTKIQIVSLPENGTLLLNGVLVQAGDEITAAELEQLTFEPADHFAGTVSFTWNGYDSTAYAAEPSTVTLTIGEQNDGMPVADIATFQTDENTTLTGSLAEFISDPEGRGLVYEATPVVGPVHGPLTINPDGTFTYVPEAGYRGKDTFTYRVCDQGNPEECTTGTVKLIVGEPDDDDDGIPDAVEKGDDPANPTDTDGDGVPDYQDDDSDNDGIPDAQETSNDPTTPIDTDGDGVPDYRDTDSDDDGLTDTQEAGDNPSQPTDSDGDGIPDYRDTDSDGDGLTDTQEAGDDPAQPTDTNGDGVPDYQSTDSDGDGLTDTQEAGIDPLNPRDTDGDGIPNYQETDSDNDGIPDSQEDVITIYEGFSPNGDAKNDTWYIDGIEDYPDNTVQIFNRWGNKIFEMKGYNNDDRAWSSESSIGLILGDTGVPDGTYFYIIDLQDGKKPRSGYLIVNRR